MEKKRLLRYADRLDHAEDRMGRFMEWVEEASAGSVKDRLACYKALQEATEAMVDVLAMVVVDIGSTPKDDYSNIDIAEVKGVIGPASASVMREANGLRNRLVHEYARLDDIVALESGVRLIESLDETVKEVRDWLSSRR